MKCTQCKTVREHDIQRALFEWAAWHEGSRPELALLFAVPNGGPRHIAVAVKLKAEGVRPGVPDVCLPVARGGYHGLWLELKRPGAKPTPDQRLWHERLRSQGHRVEIIRSVEEGMSVLLEYLSSSPFL